MSSVVFGIVVVAVALAGAIGLWYLARRAARARRWVLVIVGAGIVSFITLGVMNEVSGVLREMHPLGRPARSIMDIVADPTRARGTVDAWQTWFSQPYTSPSARPPLAPRTAALWYLGLDSFLFVPAYMLFFGVLFRRARAALRSNRVAEPVGQPSEPRTRAAELMSPTSLLRLENTSALAIGVLALVPFLDLLENGMLWRFIERRVEACGSGVCPGVDVPGGLYVGLLRVVSYAKLGALALAVIMALPPLAAWARLGTEWIHSIRPAVRRLRGLIVLQVIFFILMWINPQTKDVFRGWDWQHAAPAVVAAFLAGYVTWSAGRRVTYVRRGKDLAGNPVPSPDPGRTHAMLTGSGIVLIAVGCLGFLFGWAPRGLVIPGLLLLVLGRFDPAGDDLVVRAPAEVRGGVRDRVPAVLAAAWPILLAYFVARSLFPLTMYDHSGSFVYTFAVFVVWALALPAASIVLLHDGSLHALELQKERAALERDGRALAPPTGGGSAAKIAQAVSTAVQTTTPTDLKGPQWLEIGLVALGVFLWWRVMTHPWAVGQALGAVTLVVAFFAVLAAVVGRVSHFVERTDPPGLFKILRMQRTPVFLLIALWLVLIAVVPMFGRPDYHNVRTISAGVAPSVSAMGTTDLFARWVANQPELRGAGAPGTLRPVVPLIMVATEGGGIKAATWTTLVLDCALSPDPIVDACPSHDQSRLTSVFAESGVSGGSVGLVEYTRFAAEPTLADQPGDWIDRRLGADFVSASVAWQLYVETPRAWLQFDPGMDRAEVLERGWEQTWVGDGRFGLVDALFRSAPASGGPLAEGFRALWANDDDVPLLLLNGYSIQDGCKFVTTPIDANGAESDSLNCVAPHGGVVVPADPSQGRPGFLSGSRVLTDLLCAPADDVRLSTAALLSARFPYVSPSGRLLGCTDPPRAINVVDGGYGENTGAGSVLELWQSIRPLIDRYNGDPRHGACIVPALLQIQSGYGPPADLPTAAQGELGAPPKGIKNAPNGFTVWQRNAAQLAVLDPLPFTGSSAEPARQGVYALVYPYAHPGAEAPLGWTLSDEARSDLRSQLSATGNLQTLAALEDFLNDPGTCVPADQARA